MGASFYDQCTIIVPGKFIMKNNPAITIHIKKALPQETEVFDTYWEFAFERQEIFFRRLSGTTTGLTCDPVLNKYRFTNVYRASDRVSQFLIRHVIYSGPMEAEELFFRVLLFKIFNKIETWKGLKKNLGKPLKFRHYCFQRYSKILAQMSQSETLYSGAYIMPSGKSTFGSPCKFKNHLRMIEFMMKERFPQQITEASSLGEVYRLLLKVPSIGPFLAYQYAVDLAYSPMTTADEMDFVQPGPGARDGIHKCFHTSGDYSEADIIRYMVDRQEEEFAKRNFPFKTLWGRRLTLIDCQNLFCEVDKYARIKHPQIRGVSGRKRIKQRFRLNPEPIDYLFPPKWALTVNP